MTKLENSICDKTKKHKFLEDSKTQIGRKLKTQIKTKLKSSIKDETQNTNGPSH